MSEYKLWESLSSIPDHYITDAYPPTWRETANTAPRRRGGGLGAFLLDNGWVAAVLSAVVAVGVIAAIVLAGRNGNPSPPVGTSPGDTAFFETDVPEPDTEAETTDAVAEWLVDRYPVIIHTDDETVSLEHCRLQSYTEYTGVELFARSAITVDVLRDLAKDPHLATWRMTYGVGADTEEVYLDGVTKVFFNFNTTKIYTADFREHTEDSLPPGTYYYLFTFEVHGLLDFDGETYRGGFASFVMPYRLIVEDPDGLYTEIESDAPPAPPEDSEDWKGAPPSEGLLYTSNGDGTCAAAGMGSFDGVHLVIPSQSPEGDTVTSVAASAFAGQSHLVSVTVPGSVAVIGESAFDKCPSLRYVRLEEGVRVVSSISFTGDIEELYLPASLEEIRDSGFVSCKIQRTYLADVGAWCGVELGTFSFANPLSNTKEIYVDGAPLIHLVIPDGVTHIKKSAFERVNIRSLTLADSVESIGKRAFYEDSYLEEITFGAGIRSVARYGFDTRFSELKRVNITDITAFASIDFETPEDNPLHATHGFYHNGTLVENLVIPADCTYIGRYAFEGCITLRSLTLPENPIRIGAYAFSDCDNLESITLGGVTHIEERGFAECCVEELTFPATLVSIGKQAFYQCNGLQRVNIPGNVYEIGEAAFMECESLWEVTLSDGVTLLGKQAFAENPTKTLVLSATLSEIGDYAFARSHLTSVTIPGSVKRIGKEAFKGSHYLSDVTIGEGVEVIGDGAFWDNRALRHIVLPDSATAIEANAFRSCQQLASITLPAGLTAIGEQAFGLCGSLSEVDFRGTRAQWEATAWKELFSGCTVRCAEDTPAA